MDEAGERDLTGRFLVDPYLNWANGEGIPVHLDFGHDLLSLETARWERYDARGCFAHTHGRGDFMANYVLEVPPGTPHRFWNAAEGPARLRWETLPAGRTLEWFEALDAAGRAAEDGRPGLRAFARLLVEYGDVFRLAVPARPLVDAVLHLLAALPAPGPRRAAGDPEAAGLRAQMPGGPKTSR